jgi:hypothetical protein
MSSSIFSNYSTPRITTQPTTSSKIVVRTLTAGVGFDSTIYGVYTGGNVAEQVVNNVGAGILEAVTTGSFDSLYQISLVDQAPAPIYGYTVGTSSVGDIRCDTNPTDNDTIVIGLKTYRFKNTLAAANDVKIGASTTATMLSLSKAINLNGTVGTDYYTGTTINQIYSSSVVTNVITVTDKVPCLRTGSYPVTSTSGKFSIRTPIGGANGTLLFTIPFGQQYAQSLFTLNSNFANVDVMTLPENAYFVSGSINTNGEHPMVSVYTDDSIDILMELSQDGVNWKITEEGSFTLNPGYNFFNLQERCENIRLTLNNNIGAQDRNVDARVVY